MIDQPPSQHTADAEREKRARRHADQRIPESPPWAEHQNGHRDQCHDRHDQHSADKKSGDREEQTKGSAGDVFERSGHG